MNVQKLKLDVLPLVMHHRASAKTVRGPTNVRGLGGDSIGRPGRAVAYAALALGDDRWHAAMTPADKIARIAALQA